MSSFQHYIIEISIMRSIFLDNETPTFSIINQCRLYCRLCCILLARVTFGGFAYRGCSAGSNLVWGVRPCKGQWVINATTPHCSTSTPLS